MQDLSILSLHVTLQKSPVPRRSSPVRMTPAEQEAAPPQDQSPLRTSAPSSPTRLSNNKQQHPPSAQPPRPAAEVGSSAPKAPSSRVRKEVVADQAKRHAEDSQTDKPSQASAPSRPRPIPVVHLIPHHTSNRKLFNLSLLKTSTEHLQRDKTLYYTPMSQSSGMQPSGWPGSLREVRMSDGAAERKGQWAVPGC